MKSQANSKAKQASMAELADRHMLYQKSVQAPENEVEFFDTTYTKLRGKTALIMREDFCGTAYLSTEWCKSNPKRQAIGVDICEHTLEWGHEHNVAPADASIADRITLTQADVRDIREPKADITCALNFSFCIFKTRDELRNYFGCAKNGLKDDGVLILDMFGGTECQDELEEETEIEDEPTTYIWEHASFNPINNNIICHIHYEFDDESRMEKAFTYNWRLWSLPELSELLLEAGFSKVRIYWEKFENTDDDSDELEGTGEYYEAIEVENQESWMVYIVAEK